MCRNTLKLSPARSTTRKCWKPHKARTTASQYWRYLIPIGFIGAYTTFSTFEYETLRAIQDGQVTVGLLNVVLSVIVGFVAVWAGAAMGRVFV